MMTPAMGQATVQDLPLTSPLTPRVEMLAPESEYRAAVGWRRHVTEIADADLATAWIAMDEGRREALLDAYEQGQALLAIHAAEERLIAITILRFETESDAANFVTQAQRMNQDTYQATPYVEGAPAPANASGVDGDTETPTGDAATSESQVPEIPEAPPASYEDVTAPDLESLAGMIQSSAAARTSATLHVPGAMPSLLTITRASRGRLAFEIVTVNVEIDDLAIADWAEAALLPMDAEADDAPTNLPTDQP